ncbi:MAG: hypothetical protein NXI00_22520, partial [Cytophagales bacterium]|nr:hypothetical protein [Cytophagales bacterium]
WTKNLKLKWSDKDVDALIVAYNKGEDTGKKIKKACNWPDIPVPKVSSKIQHLITTSRIVKPDCELISSLAFLFIYLHFFFIYLSETSCRTD